MKIPKWTTASYDELFIDAYGNLCATCDDTGCDAVIKPKYQSGDILWVRETWCKLWKLDRNDQIIEGTDRYYYAADGYNPTPFNHFPDENGSSSGRDCPIWKPSIHMPKEAARIFLRATDVRAERLQEITEADAKAEGIRSYWLTKEAGENADDWHESNGPPFIGAAKDLGGALCSTRREAYQQLWDSLNAKRDDGKFVWDRNPWVWVYTFEPIEKPADWPLTA